MSKPIIATTVAMSLFASCQTKPDTDSEAVKTKYVHRYGVEVQDEADWKARGSSGQVVKTLKNGATQSTTIREGKKHGHAYTTYPFTAINEEESYFSDDRLLWCQKNYESGVPEKKEEYLPNSTVIVTTWYETGSCKSKEEFQRQRLVNGEYFLPDQEEESRISDGKGERVNRNAQGELVSCQKFEDGQIVFEYTRYANGMPKAEMPYVAGKIEGVVKRYYPTGEPKTIEEWKKGKLDGTCQQFVNGALVAQVPFERGLKQGLERRFRPGTDEVVEKINWKENRMHGKVSYEIEGETIEEWYFEGDKVSKRQFYDLSK